MAVPRSKHTQSRRDKGRMHIYLKHPVLGICPKCRKPVRSHSVCWNCGYYKGREIIDVLKKLTKKERKAREKEIKTKTKEEEAGAAEKKSLSWEGLSKK